jgi:hypothetical protein
MDRYCRLKDLVVCGFLRSPVLSDCLSYGSNHRGYSWDAHPMLNFPTSKLNFVPMLHGNAADKIQWFKSQIPNFPGWKVTHLLSFNEPDVGRTVAPPEMTC